MVFEFGSYKADIDVEKTRHFYKNAESVSKRCSCDGCTNFEEVCECYVNITNDNGTLLYGGFYHVCGTLLDGESAWKKINDSTAYWDDGAAVSVSPNFRVSFQEDISLLETGFPLPVIQLEFSASIPWVLEKKNTYI